MLIASGSINHLGPTVPAEAMCGGCEPLLSSLICPLVCSCDLIDRSREFKSDILPLIISDFMADRGRQETSSQDSAENLTMFIFITLQALLGLYYLFTHYLKNFSKGHTCWDLVARLSEGREVRNVCIYICNKIVPPSKVIFISVLW